MTIFWSCRVRQRALRLIMMQIGSREASQLLLCVVKWPKEEITIFLSEMMPCIPLLWYSETSSVVEADTKARLELIAWWRTTSSNEIIERLSEIAAILSMPELRSNCEKDMFDLSFDLLVFCDLDNDGASFTAISMSYLVQIIAFGGNIRRTLEHVLTLLPYHIKLDFFYRIIHPLSRVPVDHLPTATTLYETIKAQNPSLNPIDIFVQFAMDVADSSQETYRTYDMCFSVYRTLWDNTKNHPSLYNDHEPERYPFSGDLAESYLPADETPADVWRGRAKSVKLAFLHGYHGYERYAQPHDEIRPLSNDFIDNFNGWGVTMYDSLDTMLLMGLENEYNRAMPFIEKTVFSLPDGEFAPFFETVIRYLGGLLSAYALRKDDLLLRRADELAKKLDHVFATPSGFPLFGVNPNGNVVGPEIGILAEMASLQMEYTALAKFTGKKRWWDRANTVIRALDKADLHKTGGMFPIRWNLTSAQPFDTHLSVGAQADSTHEYLLKQYLLTAKVDKANLIMSLGAHTLPLDDLASLGIDLNEIGNESMFGISGEGYKLLAGYNLKSLHMWAAEGLAQTCWLSYADMPTGLGPDEMVMHTAGDDRWGKTVDGFKDGGGYLWMDAIEKWKASGARGAPPGVGDKTPVIYTETERLRGSGRARDYSIRKSGYLLRPETLESLYILWRTTGNNKWRDRGWKIFESIERHTKTPSGYASLRTVEVLPAVKDDDMPSYFFAETLKYLYLMFIDTDPIPLDKWVLNTEAHPLPVIEWSQAEKDNFHIP
ncbi:glycoside hydrolase family 47 protein [Lentinula edodes]|uniref:alpha-1,2-Mannosidase n=1 Tax=Lentinula edodes TaxID=5353 RepID=A0A1Q3EFK7_LENED|nr:glycoside hydrolase family 47 protein [Lentinula edodes]